MGVGSMKDLDAEVWAIGLVLGERVKRRERLPEHGVKMVELLSNSQATIRWTSHLQPRSGQLFARRINQRAQGLLAHDITTEIH